MAHSRHSNLISELSALRRIIDDYVWLLGANGVVAYIAAQDLLVITDISSTLIVSPASKYVKLHRLRVINGYAHEWGELPGAHILNEDNTEEFSDITMKSLISHRSLHVSDIVALSQAQMSAGTEDRIKLARRKKRSREGVLSLSGIGDLEIHVGEDYYRVLLRHRAIRIFSGIKSSQLEPTPTWRSMDVNSKGVFFCANDNLYGLVMPHAKINVNIS